MIAADTPAGHMIKQCNKLETRPPNRDLVIEHVTTLERAPTNPSVNKKYVFTSMTVMI